jgi:hypothetical protein
MDEAALDCFAALAMTMIVSRSVIASEAKQSISGVGSGAGLLRRPRLLAMTGEFQ